MVAPDRPSRPACFAVLVDLGIVLARPPTGQHLMQFAFADAYVIGQGAEVGGARDDRADIKVPIGPAVETAANAGSRLSSTVEWQIAHWMPIDVILPS